MGAMGRTAGMLRRSDDRRGPACLLDASPRFLVLILVLVHSLIVPQLSSSISISAPCLPLSCVRLRGRPHRKCLSSGVRRPARPSRGDLSLLARRPGPRSLPLVFVPLASAAPVTLDRLFTPERVCHSFSLPFLLPRQGLAACRSAGLCHSPLPFFPSPAPSPSLHRSPLFPSAG